MSIITRLTCPRAEDFTALRRTVDWGDITQGDAVAALRHSLFGISLYNDGDLIAMARCIGDGVFNVYIQDVVVKPAWRGKGLGQKMMASLISHLKSNLPPDCTIGLMAAHGQDAFYTQFGFISRPTADFGAGMSAQLKDLMR